MLTAPKRRSGWESDRFCCGRRQKNRPALKEVHASRTIKGLVFCDLAVVAQSVLKSKEIARRSTNAEVLNVTAGRHNHRKTSLNLTAKMRSYATRAALGRKRCGFAEMSIPRSKGVHQWSVDDYEQPGV